MPTRDEIFPSKYLKCADLKGKPSKEDIEASPVETLKGTDGKEERKTVLYFKGKTKTLPLNMTNWDSVAAICGADTDDWPGGRIELYADKTPMGGKTVDCIRIRAPRRREQTPPTAAKPAEDDMDDGIPF